MQVAKSNTATLYNSAGTATTLTHTFVNATWQAAFSAIATANLDVRLIQARPDPQFPAENPTVYGYFGSTATGFATSNVMFTVTLSGTNLVWDGVKTYGSRFNFFYPIDVGHYVIANWAIYPCTVPTTNLDYYDDSSYQFH